MNHTVERQSAGAACRNAAIEVADLGDQLRRTCPSVSPAAFSAAASLVHQALANLDNAARLLHDAADAYYEDHMQRKGRPTMKDDGRYFTPQPGTVYWHRNGSQYACLRLCPGDPDSAVMQQPDSGWTFTATGVRRHADGAISWDWSADGLFERGRTYGDQN